VPGFARFRAFIPLPVTGRATPRAQPLQTASSNRGDSPMNTALIPSRRSLSTLLGAIPSVLAMPLRSRRAGVECSRCSARAFVDSGADELFELLRSRDDDCQRAHRAQCGSSSSKDDLGERMPLASIQRCAGLPLLAQALTFATPVASPWTGSGEAMPFAAQNS
jgi:hypothetical protein